MRYRSAYRLKSRLQSLKYTVPWDFKPRTMKVSSQRSASVLAYVCETPNAPVEPAFDDDTKSMYVPGSSSALIVEFVVVESRLSFLATSLRSGPRSSRVVSKSGDATRNAWPVGSVTSIVYTSR